MIYKEYNEVNDVANFHMYEQIKYVQSVRMILKANMENHEKIFI